MARRTQPTMLQTIVNFFLTAPIAEIRQGIETAQAIVNHRVAVGEVAPLRPARLPRPPANTVTSYSGGGGGTLPAGTTGETTTQVAAGASRTRRKRSDAGVSRRRTAVAPASAQPVGVASQPMPDTAANGPGPRRRRPAVTMAAAPVPIGAPDLRIPDLPDQTVDPAGDAE